ncbi:class I SAM-dependent methyltransferase [Piscirickettsia litoralis]|uniref:Methyltransferase domain-containing protein n=1 Tax=Piscirickettsia litoralis TaxID=1891921 RepID=A0ABX3A077_9GAMM|nr:class I SAM-dependent methyltransferase [Piscirickettsia litoralis]ODN42024.1 hypothetical protein BGC07_02435 [Piscirickettsia litoralis]
MEAKKDQYTLQTGAGIADERLGFLQKVHGPDSIAFLRRHMTSKNNRILDIGCGTGYMATWMADNIAKNVTAVDQSLAQLEIAKLRTTSLNIRNIEFIQGDAYDSAMQAGQYDLTYSRFLMQHLTDVPRFLKNTFDSKNCDDSNYLIIEAAIHSGWASIPHQNYIISAANLFKSLLEINGSDFDIGNKIFHTMRARERQARGEYSEVGSDF